MSLKTHTHRLRAFFCSLSFLILVSFSFSSLFAQENRVNARISGSQLTTLAGRVHPLASAQNDQGAVAGGFQLSGITIHLQPSAAQQALLQQLLANQQNPQSPSFHQWLTPEQYADRFGVSQTDLDRVTAWLASEGLSVTYVARSRTYVSFNATAAQVQSTFHTSIHHYSVNGETHYANATNPSIPTALAGIVGSIRGLHDFHPKPHNLKRQTSHLTVGGTDHQIGPDDFATIYDVTALYKSGIDGTGQKMVIAGQTDIDLSDIQSFRSQFNLPPPTLQQILVPGSLDPGFPSTGDLNEADLDIEWSGAVARNATIIFVNSGDTWTSATYAVDQNLAPVMSYSYGECEAYDLVDLPSFRALVQQANSEGITWFAAAGDAGAADCDGLNAPIAQDGLAVDQPSSIPEITSMGGTEFNELGGNYWSPTNTSTGESALSYIPERVWNDTNLGFGLNSGGGGTSVFFPKPSWQTGPGVPDDAFRHVPDLALAASPQHDGYVVFTQGTSQYFGGTSTAAPTMAGITLLLNQYLVSSGAQKTVGLGNVNPNLYVLAQTAPSAFHDVTVGNNIVPCAPQSPDCVNGSLGYSAGPGYDQASGLGSVDAFNLVHSWTSYAVTASLVIPTIDQNPVYQQPTDAQGNNWAFHLTLTNESGIATTLTGFSENGIDESSQIKTLFGTAVIPGNGSISAQTGFKTLTVPATVTFVFTGVDAGGSTWTQTLSVPFDGPNPLAVNGANNAASGKQVFAPGMEMAIYGADLGEFAQGAYEVPLPFFLGGVEALVNNVPAALYYVSPTQVNLQIPYETQPGLATLTIGNPYENVTYTFTVASAAPGIYTYADGTITPSRSGIQGQVATVFITGAGQVRPSIADGASPSAGSSLSRLPQPRLATTVTVGGISAVIDSIGIPAGYVSAVQINFVVPTNAPLGPQPVVVTVGTVASPPATINVMP